MKMQKKMFNRFTLLILALCCSAAVFFVDKEKDEGISLETLMPVKSEGSFVLNNKVRVVKVYDGDTLDIVRQNGKKMKVRLYGIDAPEKGQSFSNTAKVFLEDAAKDRQFTMDIRYKDKYNRYVAVLFDDNGIALQEDLIRNGFAWVYPRFCDDVMLCVGWESVEEEAIRTRQGLWQDKNPLSPWDFKRGAKVD